MDAISHEFDADQQEDSPLDRTMDIEIDVTFQKKRFTSLHLEEPTAKQLEKAELELNSVNPTPYMIRRYQIAMVAAVAKVPREVVLELRNSQLEEAFAFLSDMLKPSPKDGAS